MPPTNGGVPWLVTARGGMAWCAYIGVGLNGDRAGGGFSGAWPW